MAENAPPFRRFGPNTSNRTRKQLQRGAWISESIQVGGRGGYPIKTDLRRQMNYDPSIQKGNIKLARNKGRDLPRRFQSTSRRKKKTQKSNTWFSEATAFLLMMPSRYDDYSEARDDDDDEPSDWRLFTDIAGADGRLNRFPHRPPAPKPRKRNSEPARQKKKTTEGTVLNVNDHQRLIGGHFFLFRYIFPAELNCCIFLYFFRSFSICRTATGASSSAGRWVYRWT